MTVHGPSGPLVAPLGSSVVLPCSVDQLLSVKDLEVEWRRTDSDTLVHLYQDGETQTGVQQEDYQDRAHFFTEEIQSGNFSLRLDNLRAEDEGRYTCTVQNQEETGETVVEIKVDGVEHLRVSGSSRSISASAGEDVTLKCSVDSHITLEDIEEVSWMKTDEDEDIMVLLYQNNEALPEASDERYRDRVEFFTDEIPKGNFSLRLKSVRTEDKGVYMCEVSAGGLSANTTVELERLGLIVQNSNTNVHLGGSVVLPCHVPPNLLTEDLKVEWRKTTKNSDILVNLYEDGEIQGEKQHQDYKERAHFLTDHIKHGNFSLRLDKLTAEDEGQYTCRVYNKRDCVFLAKAKLVLSNFSTLKCFCSFIEILMSGKFISLGDSVDLPCQVDKSLLENNLKVEWRRADSETLVHLYEDGKSQTDKQHKDYHKRAHFLKKKIKDGNFSLHLKKLRAGDKGIYTCKVYKDQDCVHTVNKELKLGFTVEHSHHTPVHLGASMVLPCYEDKPSRMEGLKVEWKKKDLKDLVHLYEDGESQADKQQQEYQDRAHFFTDHIKDGNFSLRLDKLRAEDEGQYTCTVHSGPLWSRRQFSAKINVVLRLLVLVRFIGTLSKRIRTIFNVLAGITIDVLPSLQFILLFFAFGSAKGGEFTFMNDLHSFMSNSARKHYSLFNSIKIKSRKICGNFPVIFQKQSEIILLHSCTLIKIY
ncbi:Butyrophilin-like protein 2 [Labeo rohita]|uniref:Butyrophilin-like protein 2 n=1 Tax=Labeo rohita TaxID=84645 RepID=A0ABQ8MVC5_LABRO|nr:Butyrophilin-like protein 2 [Labeo rohita]